MIGLSPGRRRRRVIATCCRVLCTSALAAMAAARAADTASEASIKATYIYKFLAYVDWPAQAFATPDAPQVIAVLQADGVLAELQQLAAARSPLAGGRRLVVRRVSADEPLDGVHVLHIGRGAHPADPAALRRWPLLVVTDNPAGMSSYAALNFIIVDRRVRFEASQAAAEQAGLKLSSRLLAVAERVVVP